MKLLDKVKSHPKLAGAIATVQLTTMQLTAYATDKNPFEEAKTAMNQATTNFKGVALVLAVLAGVIAGILYMFGQKGGQAATGILINVGKGIVVIATIGAIVTWLYGVFNGE